MTKINLKISVIALAIGLVMVSCGGSGSKQPNGSATPETAQAEQATPAQSDPNATDDGKWKFPKNAPLPVPEKGFIMAKTGNLEKDGSWYGTMKWTVGEAKEYAQVAQKAGFTVNVKENHNTERGFYRFTANKADGAEIIIDANDNSDGAISIKVKK
jgi:hypothetical protein